MSDANANWLLPVLERLRCASAALKTKPASAQDQAEYAAALQLVESRVVAATGTEWRALVATGGASRAVDFAVASAAGDPISFVGVESVAGAVDALLARSRPSVSAAQYVPQLWDPARQLAKDRSSNGAALQVLLVLLRVLLSHCPACVDCTPRHHLPHPVKTVGLAPRLAALDLVPCIILQSHKYSQQQQQKQQEEEEKEMGRSTTMPPSQLRHPVLSVPWLEYVRKAVGCTVPAIREKAVMCICTLLKGGVVLESAQSMALIDLMLRLAGSNDSVIKFQNDVGIAIGYLLVTTQLCGNGGDWTYFAAARAAESAEIIGHIFNPRTMTHATQRVLSVAIGELLRQTVSSASLDNAVMRVFELLQPITQDDRLYMPTIVSRAILLWASWMGSDVLRGALVVSLIRFLDASCVKTATHTALLCLAGVIRMTLATSDFAAILWVQLMHIPTRHPSLRQVTSEVMACLAQRSEMCNRALLRRLFAASGEINPHKPLPFSVALHANALLAMPAEFLRRPCVLETLLAFVIFLSVDFPPPTVEDVFLRRVEYFNRIALLLLEHQWDRLSTSTIANVKTSVRVFLSLLVSNPADTALYFRSAISACTLLTKLGVSEVELKLVVALLETVSSSGERDAAGVSIQQQRLRSAVYTLLLGASWSACLADMGKRGVVSQALADVAQANCDGVPCAPEEPSEVGVTNRKATKEEEQGTCLLGVAAECLNDYQRLLPIPTQKAQANATWRAVQLIVSCVCKKGDEEVGKNEERELCVQHAFSTLRQWCTAVNSDPAVTAWNVLCCLNKIFARYDAESRSVVEAGRKWFMFVERHWLSSNIWAVRVAAAQLLARLAVITGRGDEYTSAAVKSCDAAFADTHRLGGIIIALGEIHRAGNSATASMAISFVLRLLKQHGVYGDVAIVGAALTAMIRMAPEYMQLVYSAASTVLVPQLLLPPTTNPIAPLVLLLLPDLFSLLIPQMYAMKNVSMSVCIRGLVHAVLSRRDLSEEIMTGVMETLCQIVKNLKGIAIDGKITTTTTTVAAASSSLPVLDNHVLWKRLLEMLEEKNQLNDSMLQPAVAGLLLLLVEASDILITPGGDNMDTPPLSLVCLAHMIDKAASLETRNAWIRLAHAIVYKASGRVHLSAYQEEMELIMRAKPPSQSPLDVEDVKHESLAASKHVEEGDMRGGLTLSRKKKMHEAEESGLVQAKIVTSEVGSKLAVLSLMTEMVRRKDFFGKLEEVLTRHLYLLFWSVSLVEVEPLFVCPAVDALQAVLEKYGQSLKDGSTPLLYPWRVVLVNAIRSVIQRSVFCWKESCLLAESFIDCNLADDNSVRRVITALTDLMEALENCDSDCSTIAHGGCGRVVVALSTCRTRAAAARWLHAEQAASESIASPGGQAAAALLCNQLVASIAMMHGFEPTHDMTPTPLDDSAHATPTATLALLENMCCTVHALGPTVRHAAGCLLCLLLCTPGVALRPMRSILPLLPMKHQEVMVNTAFGLLLQEGDEVLNDEDAADVLELCAAARCVKSPAQIEFLLSSMETHHPLAVGSIASLRLAMEASCSVDCVNRVLGYINVDVLVASGEPTAVTTMYMQRASAEEREDLAFATPCGFILFQLVNAASEQPRQLLFSESRVVGIALSRLGEALAQSSKPLVLLQHVFPAMHHDVRLCATVVSVCSSVRCEELRRRWSPCVQHALLCIIHPEMMLRREETSAQVLLDRVSLFIRALVMLATSSSSFSASSTRSHVVAVEEVGSLYPDACAALIKQLMPRCGNELKSAIQSLSVEEARVLRQLMQQQQQQQGGVAAVQKSSTGLEGKAQEAHITPVIPQRLYINLSSFT